MKQQFRGIAAERLLRRIRSGLVLCTAMLVANWCQAQFAAAVTPPRFELTAKPGQVLRNVLDVTHTVRQAVRYRVYTTDWELGPDGALTFLNSLQPSSCRPWVALERHEISFSGASRQRFRFEVTVPEDAPAQECRFAVMIESNPQDIQAGASAAIPMSARIAVIVYARVGDVGPLAKLTATSVKKVEGFPTPAIWIENIGASTARVSGILEGVDGDGRKLEFTPEDVPILPGRKREVGLILRQPAVPSGMSSSEGPRPRWPIRVMGRLEYGTEATQKIEVDHIY